jgi:hypothetical protein
MALSSAEKQRNYRARKREERDVAQRATALIPLAEHEAELERRKAKVAEWRDRQIEKHRSLEAELEAARGEIARLEEELASSGKRCPVHHTELACRECSCGEDY